MADNTVLSTGSGGDTIATDDIGGVKHQRVKVEFGADGSATDVSSTDPLPITTIQTLDYDTGAGTATTPIMGVALPASGGPVAGGTTTNPIQVADAGGSLTVDGTVTANAGTNLNTSALALETGGNLATLAGAVDGTEVQVDVLTLPAIPAGTNNIGDVDVLTLPALAAGTNVIGYVGDKPTYAAKATITWTGTSLANGSARESTVIDNTTNRYRDARIRIQTKGQASGTAYIDAYVYTALGDTTYTDGATGSDAAFTAASRLNARYLGSIRMNQTTAVAAELLLSDVFATMPDKWGLIIINNSGAALSATGGDHVLEYEGVN